MKGKTYEKMPGVTSAQALAMAWLKQRGGDGMFDITGVVLASGQRAPFMRATWNTLRAQGFVEFYNPTGKGRGRLRLTTAGKFCPASNDWRLLERARSMVASGDMEAEAP